MTDNISKEGAWVVSYKIDLLCDDEANVWVATSKDVPGLALESDSADALIERLRSAVPELIALNGEKPDIYDIIFQAERTERIAAYG